MTEVERGRRHGRRGALAAPCHIWSHFLVFYYPLLVVIYLILLNKNDLHEKRRHGGPRRAQGSQTQRVEALEEHGFAR